MSDFENKNKDMDCFLTMKKWLENRNQGKTFVEYFEEYGYKSIGIYGAGDLGRLLYDEIKNSDIEIKYFVDRNGEGLKSIDGIPVVLLKDVVNQEKVDVLIVTPVGNYEAICKDIVRNIPELSTMSLKDAVFEF